MSLRDRLVGRYRTAFSDDGMDSSAVEPDEDDLAEMVIKGIEAECKRVHSKDKVVDRRWTAVSEWKDVEITRVGKNKLRVVFPTTMLEYTGGNPNDDSSRDGATPEFEIEITRVDK